MTKRIFKAVCTASLAVFAVTLILIMSSLYEYFSTLQSRQLETQTRLAARGVELMGSAYFDGLSEENLRISWISAGGEVLFDNASDSASMENHLQREEILQALSTGFGSSSRYSSTMLRRFLYCAQRLSDGTVLRLSISQNTVFVLLIGMLQPILLVVLTAAVLSFLLASGLSKWIVEPMNKLNLDAPLENREYEELQPMLRRIYNQQQLLERQKQGLKEKQNEFEMILASISEGMLLLNPENQVITANAAALKMLNVRNARIGNVPLKALCSNEALLAAVKEAKEQGNASVKLPLYGRILRIQAAKCGSSVAVVLFDVTQQEQAEQTRREFTANVSHELKTPLQTISGYSELIQCGIAKQEDIQPFAQKIYEEAQRLIVLVQDIISLSHLDEGTGCSTKPVDLYALTEEVVQELGAIAAEKEVLMAMEGESVQISSVPELLRGIVYNLCDNAVKYNVPGGRVLVTVAAEDGQAVLTVRDTGIGIPAQDIDRIFERFYRADKSRSKTVGGTGLGLAIVKHSASLLNGQITVESQLGEGTTIRVVFPQ